MQFDQKKLMQIGAVVLVAILAAVFGWNTDGSKTAEPAPAVVLNDDAPKPAASAPAPAPSLSAPEAPSLSPAKPKPVAVPEARGDFDYYLLVLSWSPTHCSSDAGRGHDDDLQ